MRVRVAGAVAVLLAVAVWLAGAAGSSGGGLHGRVLRGPVSPVCVVGKPCSVPAAVTLAFVRGQTEVARVRSASTGAYRVTLPPGDYVVRPAFRHPLWRLAPSRVHVPVGRYARVNFLLDTGIR